MPPRLRLIPSTRDVRRHSRKTRRKTWGLRGLRLSPPLYLSAVIVAAGAALIATSTPSVWPHPPGVRAEAVSIRQGGHAFRPAGGGLGGRTMGAGGLRHGCRVVSITDGDTARLDCGSGVETVRLAGFDTPELFSPGCTSEKRRAEAARRHLKALLDGAGEVRAVAQGQDRYGRTLATVYADGQPVADLMIRSGMARPYSGGKRTGWCG